MRIGTGIDIHVHDESRNLFIGTVNIDGPGFLAHSDGDIVVHALIDALLSASGLGDIGEIFPSEDKKWAGASGEALLRITKDLILKAGLIVENIDIIVISNTIKISSIKEEIVLSLTKILDLDPKSLSVKGKTTNGTTFINGENASAAFATVLGRFA